MQIAEFCREIETYLCRKNDGHLIRVTGPSFDLVAGWAAQGVPLNVAYAGIDRYFERYYRHGRRRRPVRIDFCEPDVLDVFDEWKKATGIVVGGRQSSVVSQESGVVSRESSVESRESLPTHLRRVMIRLTAARAADALGPAFDDLIDRVARELDTVQAEARALRGERRRRVIDRLESLDRELVREARAALDESVRTELARQADAELAPFRAGMAPDAFARARDGAIDRLVRRHVALPTIAFS